MDIDHRPCFVRLKNGESFILSKDGWNPNEDIPAYGPLWREDADEWTLDSNEIIMYRAISPKEVRDWRNSRSMGLRTFLEKYVKDWNWVVSDLPRATPHHG